MMTRALLMIGLVVAADATAHAAVCTRTDLTLISSSQPVLRDPGDVYNAFDGPNDHAIYSGAADWIRDEEESVFLDGLVDFDFGLVFGNGGEHPEGFDRQIKQLHEYRLAPAYAAGINADTLDSATLYIYVDAVLDMSLSGQTDLLAPHFMYLNVFAGDGLLAELSDMQADFDRCDRKFPASWDVVFPLLSGDGMRISQDEVDNQGGTIVLAIDVTAGVRDLLAGTNTFAGFAMAGSELGDFVLLSVDGGSGTFAHLPRLTLVGPFAGDFDASETIDLLDFAIAQECFSGDGVPADSGCAIADLDGDDDVDGDDLAVLTAQLYGPADVCTNSEMRVTATLPQVPSAQAASAGRTTHLGDFNGDGKLDRADRSHFHACIASPGDAVTATCEMADLNHDARLDDADVALFNMIFTK